MVDAGDIDLITSFAVDGNDNLYVIGRDGEIHRLDPTAAAADGGDSIFGGNGNDRAYGGAGRDYLNGGASEDFLRGGLDDDVVFGASGNDRLYGDAGSDRLDGGTGADKLFGGIGNDTYRIDSASDRVVDVAGEGTDTFNTGVNYSLREQDLDATGNLVNVQVEVLRAVYTGTTGIKLFGNSFSERIYGGLAGDTLNGRAGVDRLFGQGGNDRLEGGLGARDDFIYESARDSAGIGDLIADFEVGLDNIDVSAMSAQVFTFSGEEKTFNTDTAPELRYMKDTSNNLTRIYGDVNGDNAIDFQIREAGLLDHTSADFIL
jgi:Ca2+-binding RTX toxin-like protein